MQTNRSIVTRLGLAVASLALAAVLVVGFKAPDEATAAGATASDAGGSASSGTGTGSTATASPTGATATASPAAGATASAAAGTQTATGSVLDTVLGPVQVQVTIPDRQVHGHGARRLP